MIPPASRTSPLMVLRAMVVPVRARPLPVPLEDEPVPVVLDDESLPVVPDPAALPSDSSVVIVIVSQATSSPSAV